jgi:hypothetical protein
MKAKQKPCKDCNEQTYYRTYGRCSKCNAKWLLNTAEGQAKLQATTAKAMQPRIEIEKAIEAKKESKKLQWLLNNVRNLTHEFVRLRDKGLPCISCGVAWRDDFQAGHYAKAELYSNLKFDLNNIHCQCKGCNLYRDGNENGYRIGLQARHGDLILKYLDAKMRQGRQPFKWERSELKELQREMRLRLKQLKAITQ